MVAHIGYMDQAPQPNLHAIAEIDRLSVGFTGHIL